MDIATSSRPFFSTPSPTPDEKISLQASNTVYTYHCLCSHLLLATTTPLPQLPTRQHALDNAHIMPLPPSAAARPSSSPDHYGLLLSTRSAPTPSVLRASSGYETRYLQRCGRCNLVVGYQLDWAQFAVDRSGRREDFVFLFPDGFVKTADMVLGKSTMMMNTTKDVKDMKDAIATPGGGGGGVAEIKA